MAKHGILMQVSNGSASVTVAKNQILDLFGAGQTSVMIDALVTLIKTVEAPMLSVFGKHHQNASMGSVFMISQVLAEFSKVAIQSTVWMT